VQKRSVSKSVAVTMMWRGVVRGAAVVLSLYALPACFVIACSKESATTTPAPTPSIVTQPSPNVPPSTSGSELMWASSASVSASASSSVKAFACGPEGAPKCPLQGWMEKELKPAMKAADPAKVADLLDKVAKLAPASYDGWAKIASDAAAETRAKKDLAPAKKSCTSCHEKFKKRWKTEDRDHAI